MSAGTPALRAGLHVARYSRLANGPPAPGYPGPHRLTPGPAPQVLSKLPVQRLKRSTLFVDVLSVKEFPKRLLLRELPPEVDILCTHPMFGPDSGAAAGRGRRAEPGRQRARAQRRAHSRICWAAGSCDPRPLMHSSGFWAQGTAPSRDVREPRRAAPRPPPQARAPGRG